MTKWLHARMSEDAQMLKRTSAGGELRAWRWVGCSEGSAFSCCWRWVGCVAVACILAYAGPLGAADEEPFGIDHWVPWTTSHIVGSPDPPPAYAVERTFTNIQWQAPVFLIPEPNTDYLMVIQENAEKRPARILRVRDDPSAGQADLFLAVSNRLVYSAVFHPGYRTNGYFYIFSNGKTGQTERTNRISRFTVERPGAGAPGARPTAPEDGRTPKAVEGSPPRCDPLSEHTVIEWHSQGHDGGGLVFGHDGMLYISTGDGTSDSDGWATGQDLSDLLGGILRIDVDRVTSTLEKGEPSHPAYSVPRDNPFVGWTNARPELWAYGLRNPWRLAIDPKTGQIWAGNNGQDLWETAHLVRRGENYGWSVYEGSHPFYLNRKLGPTPAVPPTIEHPHSEMRSLTGGAVYYGEVLPDLNGVYVYGDYSTGQIWGARHNGSRLEWMRLLAETQLQPTAFAVSHRGELLILDHAGGVYRLVRNPEPKPEAKAQAGEGRERKTSESLIARFPRRLSESGLFVSTKDHRVQPGLIPYSVNTPSWADGAHVERFMAFPQGNRIGSLTNGAVLVQTLSVEREAGQPASRQRIETRFLTRQNAQWTGYSYRWDEDQADATLVGAKGEEREIVIKGEHRDAVRRQVWHYPSRAECMTCHSRAANFVLGLTDLQLNQAHDYGGVRDNQLRTLQHIGVFTGTLPKPDAEGLVDPYDPAQTLEKRARSYLHANCSVCHVEAGGGNAKMELGFTTARERMSIFGARPQHDTFGIDNAMLVFPGDPDRSILYQRLSRRGRGQMPPLATTRVDERAAALFRDWIRDMKPEQKFVRDWKMDDLLPALDQVKRGRSFDAGRTAFRQTGCSQCHRFAGEGGSVGPDLKGVARRLTMHDLLESLILPSKMIAEGYATTEIETKAGEVITGRVEHADDRVVVIRPLAASEEVVTILASNIRRRELSKTSNMPTGILNTLNETAVLDLLAYLISDGDSGYEAFR